MHFSSNFQAIYSIHRKRSWRSRQISAIRELYEITPLFNVSEDSLAYLTCRRPQTKIIALTIWTEKNCRKKYSSETTRIVVFAQDQASCSKSIQCCLGLNYSHQKRHWKMSRQGGIHSISLPTLLSLPLYIPTALVFAGCFGGNSYETLPFCRFLGTAPCTFLQTGDHNTLGGITYRMTLKI